MEIAEGFVQKYEMKSLEDMAEDYVTALIRRSLVMVAKQNSAGGAKTCQIHVCYMSFVLRKPKKKIFYNLYMDMTNFLILMSHTTYDSHAFTLNLFVNSTILPHVHSLLCISRGAGCYVIASNLLFIFRVKLLRVLDLRKVILGNTFPVEITVLVLLRYLAVGGKMKDIPSLIENLSKLETFYLTAHNGHVSLPDTILNM